MARAQRLATWRHWSVAVLLMVPLLSCSGGSDPEPSGPRPPRSVPSLPSVADGVSQLGVPQLVNLVVTNGVVTGVPDVVEVKINAPVRLTVLSDTAAVLLVRGYDVRVQLTVGQPAQVEFLAGRTGDFDVVLESSGLVLTTLQVS